MPAASFGLRRAASVGVAALFLLAALPGRQVDAQGAGTGTLEGRARLTAAAPANPVIRMGADPVCASLQRARGRQPTHEIVVRSADGGLANVFVSVQGSF